ncbi:putative nitrogen fixation protein NifT [Rhizomicrobium electricum]|jgi:nitrogen fixation protein NifT|uniref:Nitrogen fixation protein NifT n=1 Tax=Rhizomicrobium electricum TaxID=480070 RepID=A0ABP3Q0X4_9PROT|nr:putative nitrogen fixation protein NifT [Rhizomicrobium electricum]NIJ50344.1 nitrogen fixation protein NifT [Rhizomicrobium electricum]
MKIMLRKTGEGYAVYVAKKDLEEKIVAMECPCLWGGKVTLANGWVFQLPDMAPDTRLPISVEARRLEA